jgi:hypothetical protein
MNVLPAPLQGYMVGHRRPLRGVKGLASTYAADRRAQLRILAIYITRMHSDCKAVGSYSGSVPIAQQALRYVYVCDIQTAWAKTI